MTKQQIKLATQTAQERGEDLQLWQAVEWMYAYHLITYKEYTAIMNAQCEARKASA